MIDVTAVNDAPVRAAAFAPITVSEDSGAGMANLVGMFNDPDGDPLALSVSGVSNGALFAPAPSISGTTLPMPVAPDQNGTATVTIAAIDPGGLSVSGDVALTVTPANDSPTVVTPIPDLNPPEDSARSCWT